MHSTVLLWIMKNDDVDRDRSADQSMINESVNESSQCMAQFHCVSLTNGHMCTSGG